MIVVKIELWPRGNQNRACDKGRALIVNNGSSGELTKGNYDVFLYKSCKEKSVWKRGRVEGFPRKRLGPYDLLYRALREIVGDRNPPMRANPELLKEVYSEDVKKAALSAIFPPKKGRSV